MNRVYAITNCRVSSDAQLQSGSIGRQTTATEKRAKELGAEIVQNWSGSVSSKAGTNISRTDLEQMLEACRRNKKIKYAIFDELDRFMRSILEIGYFLVLFRELGVTVVFASQPELKTDTAVDTLMLMLEAFKAEGSNEERQRKSISGHNTALGEGRYTFHPKSGYKKGSLTGVPEIHEVRGPALRSVLIRIATKVVTPTQGLIELNNSDYTKSRAPLKMDKFRQKAVDAFYAGIVEINKQVNVRNPYGLHEPLIAPEHHLALVDIFSNKKKNQLGPLKNGNPKYPVNNMVNCELCTSKTNGRYVGYDHGNGKNPELVYEKYRCRGCGRYLTRQELHPKIEQQFNDNPITTEGLTDLTLALDTVWKEQEGQAEQEIIRINHKIKNINETISNQVEAVTDPSNASVKEMILESIAKKKAEISDLEEQLKQLQDDAIADKEDFLKFAFGFVDNMGSNFLDTELVSKENRLRCKQLVFPSGFYLDKNNRVYTPEISILYRLATNKKDTEVSNSSQMVRVKRL